jgi:protein NRD1
MQPVATPNASHSEPSHKAQAATNQFDMSTFDFSSPASWEALAKTWQMSQGYMPSQEELMQYVMMSMQMNPAAMMGASMAGAMNGPQFNQGGMDPGFHGQTGWSGQYQAHQTSNGAETAAQVLGEPVQDQTASKTVGEGGKMERVGDKWVFVKKQA